ATSVAFFTDQVTSTVAPGSTNRRLTENSSIRGAGDVTSTSGEPSSEHARPTTAAIATRPATLRLLMRTPSSSRATRRPLHAAATTHPSSLASSVATSIEERPPAENPDADPIVHELT